MNLKTSKFALVFVFAIAVLPACASLNGGISRSSFYDTEKTIMTDLSVDKNITTGKYWSKNLLYPNRYRPLFMLSNKDLFNMNPAKRVKIVQRNEAPAIYNISFKTSSLKTISLTPEVKQQVIKNETKNPEDANIDLISAYEKAKNPTAGVEDKINTVVLLKNTKKSVNYKMALDLLNDITKEQPLNAYAYYLKGELYAMQNSPASAMTNYIEALKINPKSKQCYSGIAKILEPNDKELAQKYYEMAKN